MKRTTEYKIPLEMTEETAADFGISSKELQPLRIGARRTRGIFVPVSEEVYRAYMRPLWREAKREERREAPVSLEQIKEAYEWELPAAEDVAEEAERREQVTAIRSAMARLPKKDRKILALFAEGRRMAEIAEAVGMSERGARGRKEAALFRLREMAAQRLDGA